MMRSPAEIPERPDGPASLGRASVAARILVVDDDSELGEFVAAAATGMGMRCAVTTNAVDFLAALRPDVTLVLSDLMMPDMDGLELLRHLGEQQCRASIILMSGCSWRVLDAAESFARSLDLSVAGKLLKPFRLLELEKLLRAAQEEATR